MKLQTEVPLQKAHFPITYEDELLLLGSCFVTNLSEKLAYYQFRHTVNPFGVVFNPVSIEKLISRAINETLFTEADIFFFQEQWHCFEVHSQCSHSDKEVFLGVLNSALQTLSAALHRCSYFVLTLGTAWVYRHIETDTLVANCHKVPQRKFLKELLTVEEVIASLENIFVLLKEVNPEVKIVVTVSPVRHLKDGFAENARSKAHLISALHEIIEPRNKICYFPSYEIMMDELRDYRFYKEDMVHPNALAVSYIWERFADHWVADESKAVMKEVEVIQKGLQHRPFNPDSEAHIRFLNDLERKSRELRKVFPFFNFQVTI